MMAVCLAEPQIIGTSPSKAGSGCCTPSNVHPPVVSKTSPLKEMSISTQLAISYEAQYLKKLYSAHPLTLASVAGHQPDIGRYNAANTVLPLRSVSKKPVSAAIYCAVSPQKLLLIPR